MTRMVLYSAIAAAVGLSGCAGGTKEAALPCNQGVCKVAVTITNCAASGGVSVEPVTLRVDQTNNIEWEFATGGYLFAQNGIVIGVDPKGELDPPVLAPNRKKITVHDHHKETNYWIYYAVNVTKEDGTPCVSLDPWIYNR